MNQQHVGTDFDEFLREEGILEHVEEVAAKRVIAFAIAKRLEERGLTRKWLAEAMNTSRASVNRLLDPSNPSVTLSTVCRAMDALQLQLTVLDVSPRRDESSCRRIMQHPPEWSRYRRGGGYELGPGLKRRLAPV